MHLVVHVVNLETTILKGYIEMSEMNIKCQHEFDESAFLVCFDVW